MSGWQTVHMSLSVRGALRWPKRKLRIFTDPATGRPADPDAAREWLMDQLALGHEVIPLTGEPCEGFDFKTGCPGHRKPEPTREEVPYVWRYKPRVTTLDEARRIVAAATKRWTPSR